MDLFFDPFSGMMGFSMLHFLFFGIVILVILGMIVYRFTEFLKNVKALEEVVQAKLIDKITQTQTSTDSKGMTSFSTSYTFTFELARKERKSFNVSRKNYLNYVVGDTGWLSFQRKRFNDFKIE